MGKQEMPKGPEQKITYGTVRETIPMAEQTYIKGSTVGDVGFGSPVKILKLTEKKHC